MIFFFIVLLANFVEAIAGFGSTLIALTLGSFFFSIESLVPLLVSLNLILSLFVVIKDFKWIEWELFLKKILLYSGLGLPIGIILSKRITGSHLKIAFSIFVIGFAVIRLFKRDNSQKKLNPSPRTKLTGLTDFLFLFSGGIMQGVYATGGPLIVTYASQTFTDKRKFRATLQTLWMCLNLVVFVSAYLPHPEQLRSDFPKFLELLPAVMIGILVGDQVHQKIKDALFQKLTYSLLFLSGTALLCRSLF